MSFNGSGTFLINSAGNPVVTGTVISSTWLNALTADLATGLSNTITKDGQSTPTANIPMGGFKLTGLAAATLTGDALSYGRPATVTTLACTTLAASGLATLTGGFSSAAASTVTAKLTLPGSSTAIALKLTNALEKFPSSATAATGTINFDVLTQACLRYSTNAAANWTINFRGDGSNTLDSLMAVDESVTVAFAVKQGGTAFYNNVVKIDGNTVTPVWQGVAPTAGLINGYDIYSYVIQKAAAATFFVLASLVSFS